MTSHKRTFLSDAIDLVALGSHSLENDDFSQCFKPVPQFQLDKSGVLYILSFIARYFILFPFRLILLLLGGFFINLYFLLSVYCSSEKHISQSFLWLFKLLVVCFNCHIKHYGEKKRIENPHLYVSNHSSFIDYIILSSYKFCHSCIAENHGGLFGFIFNSYLSKNGCISFKRTDRQEREAVVVKIKSHISANKCPMLIFPEGTCVNNKFVTLFQKGSFELGVSICPVAIKYSKTLMDPYWNRRVHNFTSHLFYLMTRWKISAEVYWMDPVEKRENENTINFSHRVKNLIAKKAGLCNTLWNGSFKSSPLLKDREIFKNAMKMTYVKQKYGLIESDKKKDLEEHKFYLIDENINQYDDTDKIYFDSIGYKIFINECCKQYLRLKECSSENTLEELIEKINPSKTLEIRK